MSIFIDLNDEMDLESHSLFSLFRSIEDCPAGLYSAEMVPSPAVSALDAHRVGIQQQLV